MQHSFCLTISANVSRRPPCNASSFFSHVGILQRKLYPQIRHVFVFQTTNSLSVNKVFGGFFASMASTAFIAYPRSHSNGVILFDSDAHNAAAYNSDSALLPAMIFCLRVCAFNMWLPISITPALLATGTV